MLCVGYVLHPLAKVVASGTGAAAQHGAALTSSASHIESPDIGRITPVWQTADCMIYVLFLQYLL